MGDAPTLDCATCHGRWVDRKDVRTALGPMTTFSSGANVRRELRPRRLWSSTAPAPTGRACPRCREAMVRHAATAAGPVWVDECPARHGIWFDEGELETLVEFAREGGLAHHLPAHAHAHAPTTPEVLEEWRKTAHPTGPQATGFHWWWYLQ